MTLVLWEQGVYEVVDDGAEFGEPDQIAIKRHHEDGRYRPAFWVDKSEVQLLA